MGRGGSLIEEVEEEEGTMGEDRTIKWQTQTSSIQLQT